MGAPDQAAERTIKAVAELQRPLRAADDCEALGIGEKSARKLREIVSTGCLRRNQARPTAASSCWSGSLSFLSWGNVHAWPAMILEAGLRRVR